MVGQCKLPRDAKRAADGTRMKLPRRQRAGEFDEHGPGVGRHPFAELPRRYVLQFRRR